ncbi:MAG: endopeptidase La [Desulfovibrionaceae bacterium]|jgi:ATP-dependent Lon protease
MAQFEFHEGPQAAVLPMMSLREVVMFPRAIVPLFVGREASIKAIEAAVAEHDKKIFLVTQKTPEKEKPGPEDLYAMGTVSKVLQMLRLPDGTIKVLFEGVRRGRWDPEAEAEALSKDEPPLVRVLDVNERETSSLESAALVRAVHEALENFAKVNKKLAPETVLAISTLIRPGKLADAIMPHLKVEFPRKQTVLEQTDPIKRLEEAYELLLGEIEIISLEKKVKTRVKNQMEKNQKEYYLNEQLKAINKEMGREDDPAVEATDLLKRLDEKKMDEESKERVAREIKKLKQMPPSSAEYTVVRNYVDWVLDLPWGEIKETNLDISEAEKILNTDHFGLEKPKERILEYLAVQSMVEKQKGPILCLVGPPGVGKTSLAKSVAHATDRECVRISLGGVRDEAEIRGHRRTYVGALPGKIIQALRRCKYNNPVLVLDEVDKLSSDFRGDPTSALLEVLDPEQNYSFNDHYLDLDYDLSQVFFITTANVLHHIPGPLQDRMEIIRLPGYLEDEKMNIAKGFLVPKQLKENGVDSLGVQFSDNALLDMIRYYTREAGVRNLEREISSICRKMARKTIEAKQKEEELITHVTKQNVGKFLGVPKFHYGEKEDSALVGVTTGLAWTEVGGEMLMVETAIMHGQGKVEITGKLGEVMQESAKAALAYIRSRADQFGLKHGFHKEIDIHVHVPEGATPKDGPSAGVTMATSMVSALLNIPVRNDLAMTGEITLRGRVLPIGGLREKLLAAKRALIDEVLIPKDNVKDLKEIPAAALKNLTVTPVEHLDEVLAKALICSKDRLFCGRDTAQPVSLGLFKEEFQTGRESQPTQ